MKKEDKKISTEIAKDRVERDALFVDVRERYELAEISYDVPHIVNIPLNEFNERFIELPRDKKLIIVCRRGRRSLIVTKFLLQQGFVNVVNMIGGVIDWEKKISP